MNKNLGVAVLFGITLVPSSVKAAFSAEQGKAAYDLIVGVPTILIQDLPSTQKEMETRKKNMDVLYQISKKQKEQKKIPAKAISITSYLVLGEVKTIIDDVISVIDIIQNKIILNIGTVINKKDIGAPLNKVTDILVNVSEFLLTFIDTQALVLSVMTATEDLEKQKQQLISPLGVDILYKASDERAAKRQKVS